VGDPKQELVVCRVNKHQKDVQMFIAERAVLNELSYLTANTTAIFVTVSKIMHFSNNIFQTEGCLEFSKALCQEDI